MYTGNPRARPTTIWNHLGIMDGIAARGWPTFDPDILDLRNHQVNTNAWPTYPPTEFNLNGSYMLAQRPAVIFHYGPSIWQSQLQTLLSALQPLDNLRTESAILDKLHGFIQNAMLFDWKLAFIAFAQAMSTRTVNQMHAELRPDIPGVERYTNNLNVAREAFMDSEYPFAIG